MNASDRIQHVNCCCAVVCRPQTCEYGDQCPKAHSQEELQEWIMCAAEEKAIRQNIEAQGFMPYNQRLLEEYRASSHDGHVVSTILYVSFSLYTPKLVLSVQET